jgi:NTP pyrophosphatase (non-canonical NTP hydrolase)
MTLNELQGRVDSWILSHGGYWDEFGILARMTEELGEVAGALQRSKGLRPIKQEVDIAGELADLLFTLMAFANLLKIDLTQEMERVFKKYDDRDGIAWESVAKLK